MPTLFISTLQELVRALAAGTPVGRLHAAGKVLAYSALANQAIARAVSLEGLQGQRVVLTGEPSPEFLIELLACWQAEVLPLLVDPWTGAQADQLWLQQLGAVAAWHQGQWRQIGPEVSRPALPLLHPAPDAPALVLFTSGSSGEPKGVVLSHGQILANLQAVAAGMALETPDSVGVMLPLHHSFALITQVLLTLWTGGELHLMPAHWLPGERLAYLQQQRLHRLAGVPTHFRLLLDDEAVQLPDLRHIKVAGAALEPGLGQRILGACPAATLWVGYGLTEAGPRVSAIDHHDRHFATGSAGRALPGVQLKIAQGELLVRSPALMSGYLDQPEATAAALHDGWLATGDTACLEDGYLYILGRRDEMFLVAGEKIAPLEIEKVLLGCAGVTGAAVYGEPDPVFGHRLVALIQGETELPALRRHARRQLPPEKRPQSWYAVNQLPLTANGKLRRKELPQWPKQAFTPRS
ncbi:MAG: class I adenylate-forming enzyme family protein [Candidatus Sericytochromatia bacterium]